MLLLETIAYVILYVAVVIAACKLWFIKPKMISEFDEPDIYLN